MKRNKYEDTILQNFNDSKTNLVFVQLTAKVPDDIIPLFKCFLKDFYPLVLLLQTFLQICQGTHDETSNMAGIVS